MVLSSEPSMLNQYKIITVTHRRIDLREIVDYVVHPEEGHTLEERLAEIKEQFRLEELMYLATCNRVVYLFWSNQESLDEVFAGRFLQAANPKLSSDALDRLGDVVHLLEGEEAISHLLEVAASIDSLVVGERQILGQLREAYQTCHDNGLAGDRIRLLLQHVVRAAKSVYSHTRIGAKPVSIVSLAIQRLKRAQLPKDARILLIGAGSTNQLVGKFLEKNKFLRVTVFNRTLDKARQLAGQFSGAAHPLSELRSYTGGFDCIIVCTGARQPVITPEIYERLLQGERNCKVVIDLSVPHNVDPRVVEQFDTHYIEIEGLRSLAKENLAFREREVSEARALLQVFLEEFPIIYNQRRLEIAMRQVPEEIKAIRSRAVNEVFRKEVDQLDASSRELIERMMAYMEKKCIGIPMKAARKAILK